MLARHHQHGFFGLDDDHPLEANRGHQPPARNHIAAGLKQRIADGDVTVAVPSAGRRVRRKLGSPRGTQLIQANQRSLRQ